MLRIILRNRDNLNLGIDMNEHVRTGKLAKRLMELGSIVLILSTHPLESHLTEILLEPQSTQSGAALHGESLVQNIDRLMMITHLHGQIDIVSFGLLSATIHF